MLIDLTYRKDGERSVLSLPYALAPCQLAVFPLQKDEKIEKKAAELYDALRHKFKVITDSAGSIGKRYARMDEIGTPFCITVDFDTVDEKSDNFNSVTVRYRDDKKQVRKHVKELEKFFYDEYS